MIEQAIHLFLDAEREIRHIGNQVQSLELIEYINRKIFNEYQEVFVWNNLDDNPPLLLRKVYEKLGNLTLCDIQNNKYSAFIKENQLELDADIKKGIIHCIADSEEEYKKNSRNVIWKQNWEKSE